jgi:hypothetical protein
VAAGGPPRAPTGAPSPLPLPPTQCWAPQPGQDRKGTVRCQQTEEQKANFRRNNSIHNSQFTIQNSSSRAVPSAASINICTLGVASSRKLLPGQCTEQMSAPTAPPAACLASIARIGWGLGLDPCCSCVALPAAAAVQAPQPRHPCLPCRSLSCRRMPACRHPPAPLPSPEGRRKCMLPQFGSSSTSARTPRILDY